MAQPPLPLTVTLHCLRASETCATWDLKKCIRYSENENVTPTGFVGCGDVAYTGACDDPARKACVKNVELSLLPGDDVKLTYCITPKVIAPAEKIFKVFLKVENTTNANVEIYNIIKVNGVDVNINPGSASTVLCPYEVKTISFNYSYSGDCVSLLIDIYDYPNTSQVIGSGEISCEQQNAAIACTCDTSDLTRIVLDTITVDDDTQENQYPLYVDENGNQIINPVFSDGSLNFIATSGKLACGSQDNWECENGPHIITNIAQLTEADNPSPESNDLCVASDTTRATLNCVGLDVCLSVRRRCADAGGWCVCLDGEYVPKCEPPPCNQCVYAAIAWSDGSDWPTFNFTINGVSYTKEDLLRFLNEEVPYADTQCDGDERTHARRFLSQLVAAKLNVANGACGIDCIQPYIDRAEALLGELYGIGTNLITGSLDCYDIYNEETEDDDNTFTGCQLQEILHAYNNGLSTSLCEVIRCEDSCRDSPADSCDALVALKKNLSKNNIHKGSKLKSRNLKVTNGANYEQNDQLSLYNSRRCHNHRECDECNNVIVYHLTLSHDNNKHCVAEACLNITPSAALPYEKTIRYTIQKIYPVVINGLPIDLNNGEFTIPANSTEPITRCISLDPCYVKVDDILQVQLCWDREVYDVETGEWEQIKDDDDNVLTNCIVVSSQNNEQFVVTEECVAASTVIDQRVCVLPDNCAAPTLELPGEVNDPCYMVYNDNTYVEFSGESCPTRIKYSDNQDAIRDIFEALVNNREQVNLSEIIALYTGNEYEECNYEFDEIVLSYIVGIDPECVTSVRNTVRVINTQYKLAPACPAGSEDCALPTNNCVSKIFETNTSVIINVPSASNENCDVSLDSFPCPIEPPVSASKALQQSIKVQNTQKTNTNKSIAPSSKVSQNTTLGTQIQGSIHHQIKVKEAPKVVKPQIKVKSPINKITTPLHNSVLASINKASPEEKKTDLSKVVVEKFDKHNLINYPNISNKIINSTEKKTEKASNNNIKVVKEEKTVKNNNEVKKSKEENKHIKPITINKSAAVNLPKVTNKIVYMGNKQTKLPTSDAKITIDSISSKPSSKRTLPKEYISCNNKATQLANR